MRNHAWADFWECLLGHDDGPARRWSRSVSVCCSVWCSVLQHVVVCCRVWARALPTPFGVLLLQCICSLPPRLFSDAYCSASGTVLQCVAVRCSVLQYMCLRAAMPVWCICVAACDAVCSSVLQCAAVCEPACLWSVVCCSVCCRVLQCVLLCVCLHGADTVRYVWIWNRSLFYVSVEFLFWYMYILFHMVGVTESGDSILYVYTIRISIHHHDREGWWLDSILLFSLFCII